MAFKTGSVSVPANGSALVYQSPSCVPATVVIQNPGGGQLGLWDGNSAHASTPASFPVTLTGFVGQVYLQNNTANEQTASFFAADVT